MPRGTLSPKPQLKRKRKQRPEQRATIAVDNYEVNPPRREPKVISRISLPRTARLRNKYFVNMLKKVKSARSEQSNALTGTAARISMQAGSTFSGKPVKIH